VKAQNVMRETGGRIVLMDFGSGWERGDAGRKREVSPEGTPLYMAPELFAASPRRWRATSTASAYCSSSS